MINWIKFYKLEPVSEMKEEKDFWNERDENPYPLIPEQHPNLQLIQPKFPTRLPRPPITQILQEIKPNQRKLQYYATYNGSYGHNEQWKRQVQNVYLNVSPTW